MELVRSIGGSMIETLYATSVGNGENGMNVSVNQQEEAVINASPRIKSRGREMNSATHCVAVPASRTLCSTFR